MGLLVLSRQRDESVMIGDDIEVTVQEVRGDKVRLSFSAPKDVAIHRKEVFNAIKREAAAKCPNCNKPGSHFVPPSLGESGFYICEELKAAKQTAEGGAK